MGKLLNRLILLPVVIVLLFSQVRLVKAREISLTCANRYLTLINPVRGRSLWADKSLKPIEEQYLATEKYNYPATWLLTYDALIDNELASAVKSFRLEGERGVFLEVTPDLAEKSGIAFPYGVRWSDPGAVFLSAYSPSQRRTIIDTLYREFKKQFGYYPKSAGAWWVDASSVNYLKKKYSLKSLLIVADQKVTDDYGVWGQWWGVPYYPAKANILVPGGDDYLNTVVIQWAQRHPVLAYGDGAKYSNYSLQANDYIRNGKNTAFFSDLVKTYLDCINKVGQITVGMETGMEATAYQNEYLKQLETLSRMTNLKAVTMSEFADAFGSVYPQNPDKVIIGQGIGQWEMTKNYRKNVGLNDYLEYKPEIAFKDFFLADRSGFLDRRLPLKAVGRNLAYFPTYLVAATLLGVLSFKRKIFLVWLWSVLFAIAAFGLIFLSKYQYGWAVYYGPVFNDLSLAQTVLAVTVFFVIWLLYLLAQKKVKNPTALMWFLPLSFGVDKLVSFLRYTKIGGEHYLGILLNNTQYLAFKFGNSSAFIKKDFPILNSESFLRFPFAKIWESSILSFLVYPLVHIAIGLGLFTIYQRLPHKIKKVALLVLIILFAWQIMTILRSDPRVAIP